MPQTIIILDKDGNPVDSLKVEIAMAKGKIPIDVQARLNKLDNGLSSQVIDKSAYQSTSYIKVADFDKVGVITKASSSHAGRMQVIWSNDGVNNQSWEVLGVATAQHRQALVEVKAPYMKLTYENQDTVNPVTVDTWFFSKV
jgi:hypothetical protein